MWSLLKLIWLAISDALRSKAAMEAEIAVLRQQINVLRRTAPKRLSFTALDRFLFAILLHFAPAVRQAFVLVWPETVVRWHRAGFRA